jgi:hypothetical protein
MKLETQQKIAEVVSYITEHFASCGFRDCMAYVDSAYSEFVVDESLHQLYEAAWRQPSTKGTRRTQSQLLLELN